MGDWKIVVPEAATNLVLNPSGETSGNYAAFNGATIGRTTAQARFGAMCYVCSDASGTGLTLTTATLANAIHTLTFYVDSATSLANLSIIINGYNLGAPTLINSGTNWNRVTKQIPAANASGATAITIVGLSSITFYVDGVQLEQNSYYTTYLDGDQPGCTWSGLRHGSTSSRAANYRLGGREYDIEAQYGLRVRKFFGAGAPDYELMTQDLALQPGSVYLREKINARTLTLVLDNHHTSLTNLHARRKAFWNVIKPDALGNSQPFLIGYSGGASGKTVYSAVRYAGGWGIDGGIDGGANYVENNGAVALRLLAVDPFWRADDQETAVLNYQTSITGNYAVARINGAWQNLGSGLNGQVYAIAADKERGRVYFGGGFTTANGVTVNGVCYWNGTTFVAMGSTPGVSGGGVSSLAIAPNGDVWVGGSFTSAGGAASYGLARWNVSSETWTRFTNGTSGNIVYAIAIDKNGLVYIGGYFTDWGGNANNDYIMSYNGTTFSPLSTGCSNIVNALAIGLDGTTLYVGGQFTSPQTRIMSWNGSTFSAMGSGADNTVYTIAVGDNGVVYAGGVFTTTPAPYVAQWNGSVWSPLGSGVNDSVYRILKVSQKIIVGGFFTTAGSLTATGVAVWNGSVWTFLDVEPVTSLSYVGDVLYDNLFLGSGTHPAKISSGLTTVTVTSTAPVYPVVTVTGPTTTASTCTLKWLENQTTGERLYFNLTINTGEVITIDLRPTSRKVTSNWRGQIFDQPLPTSDFSSWHLVTGPNTIAAFITGTTLGVTATMNWRKVHASIDGEAA